MFRLRFIFPPTDSQFSQHHLLKSLPFFYLIGFVLLSKINRVYLYESVSGFILFHLSTRLDYCNYSVSLNIGNGDSSHLFPPKISGYSRIDQKGTFSETESYLPPECPGTWLKEELEGPGGG